MTTSESADYRDGRLPLAEVLAEIGESFRLAEVTAQEHPEGPMVAWHGAELELQASLTKDASGRIRVWVVEAGGGVAATESVKITVHLSPWTGQPIAGGK